VMKSNRERTSINICRRYVSNRYASEVDVDFVRKAVKAIGQTAIKIESAAPKCVQVLLDLIQTRVSYVVQEGVVVIKVGVYSEHSP
jgi:vesicle coat complex subunit